MNRRGCISVLCDHCNIRPQIGFGGFQIALHPLNLLLRGNLVVRFRELHLPPQELELAIAFGPNLVDRDLLSLPPDVVQVVQQLIDHARAHVDSTLVAEVVSDLEGFRRHPVLEFADSKLLVVLLWHNRLVR